MKFLYYRHTFFLFFAYLNVLCNRYLYNDWYMFYNIRLFNISVNEDLSFVIQYWYINVCSIREYLNYLWMWISLLSFRVFWLLTDFSGISGILSCQQLQWHREQNQRGNTKQNCGSHKHERHQQVIEGNNQSTEWTVNIF